ncbi:RidA family protein [Pseudomonas tructae]|uniref:RidA family protein n=1 Tax=Pseudomonas tructae TaxID=2518644 RepID=A0A411MJ28_9PSED|nr:RidA family protein [Pseudomonas tructae]QBF26795.1 RidA family protein [Pseudomonas tructae]
MSVSPHQRLEQLGITLTPPSPPAAAYLPWVQSGNLLFISGHIAKHEGAPWVGQLGRELDTATGQSAARSVGLDLLATLLAATGDLNRIHKVVKLLCLVNSSSEYTEQHLVANGCSQLLEEVFGERGKHARSAFGASQIPRGACVEIELIVELTSGETS